MIEEAVLTDDLKQAWNRYLLNNADQFPFYSFEWHELYFSTVGKHLDTVVYHDPELQLLAPFYKTNQTLTFSTGKGITDYSEVIGNHKNAGMLWNQIIEKLQQSEIKQLSLYNIRDDSPTLSFFKQLAMENTIPITISHIDTTPKVELPPTYDEYLLGLSRKDRHELKRKIRKLDRECEVKRVEHESDLERGMDLLINLMKLDDRKRQFFSPEHETFFRKLPSVFSQSLAIHILYMNEKPSAAILGFITQNQFLLYNSGFDQQHCPGSGFYVKAKSVEFAIQNGLKEYNFLRGNERYKYELGGKDFAVYDISIQLD